MKFQVDINEWHVSIDTYSSSGAAVCFSRIFFSEVLNLNKFLRIVFIFCASWAILNRQNSHPNYNKNEKKKKKNEKNSSKIFSRECKWNK